MKLSIICAILNQHELTLDFLDLIFKNTNQLDELILIDNGSQPHISDYLWEKRYDFMRSNKITIIRNNQNLGAIEPLNQGLSISQNEICIFTHNDVLFNEKGWDDKIREAFKKHPEAGMVGAYGAKGIGNANIYQVPYVMQQLARNGNVSNCPMNKEVHGFRNLQNEFENVAVFDGFFMAIKKELLKKTEGFGKGLYWHHNQDNLISIQSLENGYENIVIPLNIFHLGGRTDCGEDWTKGTGKTKQQIHQEAHVPFFEYGRGILPVMILDIYDENNKIVGYELYMNRKLVKTKIYE